MSHKYITDAREVVKTGQVVKVRVQEVDLARKRISLTMKLDAPTGAARQPGADNKYRPAGRQEQPRGRAPEPSGASAMANAFAKLKGGGG
jgi:uncharacterized protein